MIKCLDISLFFSNILPFSNQLWLLVLRLFIFINGLSIYLLSLQIYHVSVEALHKSLLQNFILKKKSQ